MNGIITYNAGELKQLVDSDKFKQMSVIPISRIRANSHLQNPRLKPEDAIMIIYWEEGEMQGYLGVLADDIHTSKEHIDHAGWLSCMWVNPTLRGKGIAKKLIQTAFESWGYKILVTEFTPEAKGLYDRTQQFISLPSLQGMNFFTRLNSHEIVKRKYPKNKILQTVLKPIDSLSNILLDCRFSFFKAAENSQWKKLAIVTDEILLPILNEFSSTKINFEKRNAADLNWILAFPWLSETFTDEVNRYHFSCYSKRFKTMAYQWNEHCICIITIRENKMKIPYLIYKNDFEMNQLVNLLQQIIKDFKINELLVFDQKLIEHFSQSMLFVLHKRKAEKHFIMTKTLADKMTEPSSLLLFGGEADSAFT